MENQELDILVLSALLHDVGKFGQRARAGCSEHMADTYCPQGHTHRHVLYSDYFVEHNLPLPPELHGLRSTLARIASAHHKADTQSRVELSLQWGDRLASGHDRKPGESEGDYKTARLESVFARIRLSEDDAVDPEEASLLRYRLKALDDAEDAIFPVSLKEAQATSYKALYARFLEAVKAIPVDMGTRHFISSFITVFERFTWCIPSSTWGTRADISLYDHSYTAAAIAQALFMGGMPLDRLKESELLLCGGELSGIQNYIFGSGEQGDRGASKLLRARSFSLQMLTRSIWLKLLEECGLHPVARIMDAGGRFILLLPDTEKVRETMSRVENEAMRHVLKAYNGILRVSFATHAFRAEELDGKSFPDVFKAFNDQLELAKLHPLKALFEEGLSPVIGITSADYAQFGACPFCDLRPARGETGDEAACPECENLIHQVGRRLPNARYAVFSTRPGGLPLFGGLWLRLEEEVPDSRQADALDILSLKSRDAFSAQPVAGYVPRICADDVDRWTGLGLKAPEGEEEWQVDAPKTFDMLAKEARIPKDRGFRGLACLGVCKADVDNLGLLFGTGFENGSTSVFSLSRFAMLSRMMHHYFSSWLIETMTARFPNIYVVFAGGDDLFVLGPWSDVVLFAQTLHESFTRFAGGNREVTISAGVALAKAGVPMRVIKELAEQELEASKGRAAKEPSGASAGAAGDSRAGEKNAVTLFGVTCRWTDFAPRLGQGQWLEDLCLREQITQGFVRRLLGYSRQARAFAAGDMASGLYRAHMTYDIERNINKKEKRIEQATLDRLKALCHDESFKQMEIGITWALYRTRVSA